MVKMSCFCTVELPVVLLSLWGWGASVLQTCKAGIGMMRNISLFVRGVSGEFKNSSPLPAPWPIVILMSYFCWLH